MRILLLILRSIAIKEQLQPSFIWKMQKKMKLKLKLCDGQLCLNNRKLTVKYSQYISSNLNKCCGWHISDALLKKSDSATSAETKVFFILAFGTKCQKLCKRDIKVFWPYPVFFYFLTLFQKFCPGLQHRKKLSFIWKNTVHGVWPKA